jgi:hypothetical protein
VPGSILQEPPQALLLNLPRALPPNLRWALSPNLPWALLLNPPPAPLNLLWRRDRAAPGSPGVLVAAVCVGGSITRWAALACLPAEKARDSDDGI